MACFKRDRKGIAYVVGEKEQMVEFRLLDNKYYESAGIPQTIWVDGQSWSGEGFSWWIELQFRQNYVLGRYDYIQLRQASFIMDHRDQFSQFSSHFRWSRG